MSLDAEDIRNEKVKVLRCMRPVALDDVVVGQYAARTTPDGTTLPGYLDDATVPPGSLCPTFAAAAVFINNPRWDGVPFLLKAGKALQARSAEIRVQFRHVPGNLYRDKLGVDLDRATNELVIRIQPDEAIYLKVNNKAREDGGGGGGGGGRGGGGGGGGGVGVWVGGWVGVWVGGWRGPVGGRGGRRGGPPHYWPAAAAAGATGTPPPHRPPRSPQVPGLGLRLDVTRLDLSYRTRYAATPLPDAYERLILDVINGDKRLFIRSDELEAAWGLFTPVLQAREGEGWGGVGWGGVGWALGKATGGVARAPGFRAGDGARIPAWHGAPFPAPNLPPPQPNPRRSWTREAWRQSSTRTARAAHSVRTTLRPSTACAGGTWGTTEGGRGVVGLELGAGAAARAL